MLATKTIATMITIMLAMAAASIAVPGAAFAEVQIPEVQIPEVQIPEVQIPEVQIPEVPEVEDVELCLPPPACLLPGAEVCIQVCYPLG